MAAMWMRQLKGRKHTSFAIGALIVVLVLWVTGGGRDQDRAEALAAGALIRDNIAAEGGAIDPAVIQAWATTRSALAVGGMADAVGIPIGLPLTLEIVGYEADSPMAETSVSSLQAVGVTPVEQGDLAVGSLKLRIEHGTEDRVGVLMQYEGPAIGDEGVVVTERAERAHGRIAGPWWSLLPPLLAVLVALIYGRAIIALASAVVLGAVLAASFDPGIAIGKSGGYVIDALSDSFKLYILAFTIALVGMVQVAQRSGGNQGLIDLLGRFAKTAKSTRVAVFFMGLVVFFDDYANSLVVGSSARPMTDRMKISREKLAYIVDSTAAPVAGLAIISTWVGYEVGLFDALNGELNLGLNGLAIFVEILPMRFYCIFALVFVVLGAWSGRDFGPMRKAEIRAAETGVVGAVEQDPALRKLVAKIEPKKNTPSRWYNAGVPIGLTLATVIVGIAVDGGNAIVADGGDPVDLGTMAGWRDVFSAADNAFVLFVSSVVGSFAAIGLAVGQRILGLKEALGAWFAGVRMMFGAVIILLLAWCIQAVTKELGTSFYLVSVLEPVLHPLALPLVVFLAAAAVAFATGTSWGTMGILLPALIPLAWVMTDGDMLITLLCMGAVLDGAIFGDHCSPISDTTVMSSLATGCDHAAHVRTQIPYAVTVMLAAGIFGYVAVPLGLPLVLGHLLGISALVAVLWFVGRPTRRSEPAVA